MKKTAVKSIFAVFTVLLMLFVLSCGAFAETIQDSIERRLNELVDEYNSTDDEEVRESISEQFNTFIEQFGLEDVDLDALTETDIGKIISDLGDNLALDDFLKLAQDAWSSGTAMIQDVIGNGLGTADGSDTATTKEPVTSPNVIIAQTAPADNTIAVGIVTTEIPPVTEETAAYNASVAEGNNMVGAGITTAEPVSLDVADDSGMSAASIAVLIVLAVATIAVIVAIVIFFILKKK